MLDQLDLFAAPAVPFEPADPQALAPKPPPQRPAPELFSPDAAPCPICKQRGPCKDKCPGMRSEWLRCPSLYETDTPPPAPPPPQRGPTEEGLKAHARRHRHRKPQCKTCGIEWDALLDRPATHWTDPDICSILSCGRCGQDVCCFCWARWGGAPTQGEAAAALCPTCWDLPTPTEEADAGKHLIAQTHGTRYAWDCWIRCTLWRYAQPGGQYSPINPLRTWYEQTRDDRDDNPKRSKADQKAIDHRWHVLMMHERPALLDAVWLPPWGMAMLEAMRDERADRFAGTAWDDDDTDD